MTREGKADGLVAGASHTTADVARACIRCIGLDERFTIASSCFIMDLPGNQYGDNGTFIYADCGIIPDPNARQLSCIALTAAELASKVLNITPRIAFLSYSTKGPPGPSLRRRYPKPWLCSGRSHRARIRHPLNGTLRAGAGPCRRVRIGRGCCAVRGG